MDGVVAGVNPLIQPLEDIIETGFISNGANNVDWESVQAGDVAFLFDISETTNNYILPSGFTLLAAYDTSMSGGALAVVASYRLCTGAETGSISGMGGSTRMKLFVKYRGTNRPILGVQASSWTMVGSSNPPARSINSSVGGGPKAVFGLLAGLNMPAFSTQIPAFELLNTRSEDRPGGSNPDLVGRFYRSLYSKTEVAPDFSIDVNTSGVMGGGQLRFL